MADGGEAGFCSADRAHDAGCEYFADGGEVPADDLPDNAGHAVPADDLPDSIEKAVPADDLPDSVANEVPNEDLPPAELQAKMVLAAHPGGPSAFEAPGQQLAGLAESAAQGIAGPLAPLAETKILGVPAEDIAAREAANPGEHGIGETLGFGLGALTGAGEAELFSKAAGAASKIAKFGEAALPLERLRKIGAGAIKGLVETGLLQGSDAASKAIIGNAPPEDAVNPVFALGAVPLFGAAMGAAGTAASGLAAKAIESPAASKAAEAAQQVLAGFGHAASGGAIPEDASRAFAKGFRSYEGIPDSLVKGATQVAGLSGHHEAAVDAYLAKSLIAPLVGKITRPIGKYTVPTMVRWLSNGAQGSVFHMIDYAAKVAKGESRINNTLDALFKAGGTQAIETAKPQDIERLRDYIDDGGYHESMSDDLHGAATSEQAYAKGGHVERDGGLSMMDRHDGTIAQNMPEQHAMLQGAKGRISSYLTGMRPQNDLHPKLAFDDPPDDTEQKKSYQIALETAVNPLSIITSIKNGTIDLDHIKHMQGMYPELTQHLQKKMTERITDAQLNDKKPSFVVRQGMSMLMGAPLSGEFTPENIQAAQAVFKAKPASPGGPQPSDKPRGRTSHLSKSDQSYLTDGQARTKREQKA